MEAGNLNCAERRWLLRLARQALEAAVQGQPPPPLDLAELPPNLQAPGASFVTLMHAGRLRGCIGVLEARLPLAVDVRLHAAAAATQDYRFPPVTPAEAPAIEIEISALSPPAPLAYTNPQDLLARLRPGVDGVVVCAGPARATFLPQVWEKIPDPAEFLDHLCLKMGAPPDLWRKQPLEVSTYQVETFEESDLP